MKAWTASLLIAAALAAPARARGYGLVCGRGPLDPECGFGTTPPRDVRPEWDRLPHGAYSAYELRFGTGANREAPHWSARAGNMTRQVLFWAAVASVLL